MIVQAMWDSDSPLKQLPHFTTEVLECLSKEEPQCTTIPDLLDLDDKRRLQLLSPLMERTQLADVARAANRYPNIEVQHEVQGEDELKAGAPMRIAVQLEREMDEDEKLGPVHAPFFPAEKIEGWWLILGDPEQNKLFALKKVLPPLPPNLISSHPPPSPRSPSTSRRWSTPWSSRPPQPAVTRPSSTSCLTPTLAATRSSLSPSRCKRYLSSCFHA